MVNINITITKEEIENEDIPYYRRRESQKKINIITLPTIRTIPINSSEVKNALIKIYNGYYNYCIFLSSRSVEIFFNMVAMDKNAKEILMELKKTTIIAIGPKTKKSIEKNGFNSKLTTDHLNYSLNGIVEYLEQLENRNEITKILVPRSLESLKSNNIIENKFSNLILDQVFFYKTVEFSKISDSPEWDKFINLDHDNANYIIFTSPSTIRSFFNIIEKNYLRIREAVASNNEEKDIVSNFLKSQKIISIGPKTSEELKKRNLKFTESQEHTINGALKIVFNMIVT